MSLHAQTQHLANPSAPARSAEHGTLIISAGMQSAGSGWLFNMTNDLLIASGGDDVRALREKHNLHDVLIHQNCNSKLKKADDVARLVTLIEHGHTFTVKTHARPSALVRAMLQRGTAKAIYIYRDPRDAVVSAYARGRMRRSRGKKRAFARLRSMNMAILWMRYWLLPIYVAWRDAPGTLLVRYEDLKADPAREMHRVAEHLDMPIAENDLRSIVDGYAGDEARHRTGSHYRAGTKREKQPLSPAQRDRCERVFSRYLIQMGYMAGPKERS